jgi:CheY-like chemotaxis protein
LRRRALIVEDEVLVAMLVEEMLAELGYEIAVMCTDLDEALQAATSATFDFAVLDINLNGLRSFPIADLLAERGVPFLFATGYGAKILPDRHARVPVVQKPFSLDDLRDGLALLKV